MPNIFIDEYFFEFKPQHEKISYVTVCLLEDSDQPRHSKFGKISCGFYFRKSEVS